MTRTKPYSLSLPDELALMGLAGVIVSVLVWAGLSWIDALMHPSAFTTQLLEPDAPHAVIRLSAIVGVLLTTLLVQTLYGHRRRAEQLLHGEQTRIQQMYERSPDAILTVSSDLRVLYANGQAEALAGRAATEFLGSTCHTLFFDRDEPCRNCPVESVFATGEVAERWRYTDGGGEIGVISSVTQAFCSDCTRARLSTDGKLYTCLFATTGYDLRALLRESADDAPIGNYLAAIWLQRADRYSEIRSANTVALPKVEMSYIGG